MKNGLSAETLRLFAEVPDEPVPVTALAHPSAPAGRRHHLRRLIDAGLVEAVKQRPLTVRLAKEDAALRLRNHLERNPKNTTLFAGATLHVLGVLASVPTGLSVDSLAHEAAVHANTARTSLRRLRDRGLVTTHEPDRYALAANASAERELGVSYARHRLRQRTPDGAKNIIDISPLVRVVEADQDLGLPLTAISRFRSAGAEVVARRRQMRVHAFRDDDEVSLETAFEDARRLDTPPRTLKAMEAFLHD